MQNLSTICNLILIILVAIASALEIYKFYLSRKAASLQKEIEKKKKAKTLIVDVELRFGHNSGISVFENGTNIPESLIYEKLMFAARHYADSILREMEADDISEEDRISYIEGAISLDKIKLETILKNG